MIEVVAILSEVVFIEFIFCARFFCRLFRFFKILCGESFATNNFHGAFSD
ncbi:hypothetical protein T266_16205 [Pseudomonas aeruginosa VRFPA05]|nr:hypothetical protein T266_16205 [Pseudomonas aeruginosa VRFPA05]